MPLCFHVVVYVVKRNDDDDDDVLLRSLSRVFCAFRPFEEQAQKEEDSLVEVVVENNNNAKAIERTKNNRMALVEYLGFQLLKNKFRSK